MKLKKFFSGLLKEIVEIFFTIVGALFVLLLIGLVFYLVLWVPALLGDLVWAYTSSSAMGVTAYAISSVIMIAAFTLFFKALKRL